MVKKVRRWKSDGNKEIVLSCDDISLGELQNLIFTVSVTITVNVTVTIVLKTFVKMNN